MGVKKKGFALIAVLGLVSVLLILIGALMGTNRTAFSLLRSSQASQRNGRTIDSVYTLCCSFLESDYRFGKGSWQPRDDMKQGSAGGLSWKLYKPKPDSQVYILEGEDENNSTQFQVKIINNIKDDGSVATIEDVKGNDSLKDIPSGFCLLEATSSAGGSLDGARVLVRNPALIGASAMGNELLEIDAEEFDLFSKDPITNQVRSLSRTKISGAKNFMKGDISKILTTLNERDVKDYKQFTSKKDPVVYSVKNIEFKTKSEGSYSYLERDEFKRTHKQLAKTFKDERFKEGSKAQFDIPEISLGDVSLAVLQNEDKDKFERVAAGQYRFEQYGYKSGRIRVLTKYNPGKDPSGEPILDRVSSDATVDKFWWLWEPDIEKTNVTNVTNVTKVSDVPTNADVAAEILKATGISVDPASGSERGYVEDKSANSYISINSGSGEHAKADLLNRRLVLDNSYSFQVDGDFSLIGSSVNGNDKLRQVNPAIYFGNPADIAKVEDFSGVGAAVGSVVDGSDKQGVLLSTGSIHIQGDITGQGITIASKGDLTIEPGRLGVIKGSDLADFSLFSEKDVRISPPPILEDVETRDVGEEGYVKTNRSAINSSEKNIIFRGLIYAKQDVHINLEDTKVLEGSKNKGNKYRNLRVEGAIVAREGELRVENADLLRLIYNPKFADRLLPRRDKEDQYRRRFEVISWRTFKPTNP